MAQSFTQNYRDHSNDTGYQFEFFCDKCGNGHRSTFRTSTVGVAGKLFKAAGALFGGNKLWSAGYAADHLKDGLRGKAWDDAFAEATEEIRPKFHQCTKCGHWVCPEVCWNEARGLCEDCAPDLGEHAAAIQAQVAVEQAWEKARTTDQTEGADLSVKTVSQCPHCKARIAPGAKFCAECGKATGAGAPKKTFCTECGVERPAAAKFCPSCGAKS